MNNYLFKAEDGKHYRKIDKRQAKKIYDAGNVVIICPARLDPQKSSLSMRLNINEPPAVKISESVIVDDCNAFSFRTGVYALLNCNASNGRYLAFYAAID